MDADGLVLVVSQQDTYVPEYIMQLSLGWMDWLSRQCGNQTLRLC